MSLIFNLKCEADSRSKISLEKSWFNSLKSRATRGQCIKWPASSVHQFTLDTDGSFIADFCSGGVVRDNKGNILIAFSSYYGQGSNMEGEAFALRER